MVRNLINRPDELISRPDDLLSWLLIEFSRPWSCYWSYWRFSKLSWI